MHEHSLIIRRDNRDSAVSACKQRALENRTKALLFNLVFDAFNYCGSEIDYGHYVTGTETKPEDENYKELRDFNSRKDKAYSTIYLNVSKAYRCVIDDIENPVAAWKRLEEHFKPNSRARVIGLTNDFLSCRIKPQEEIGIYATRIRSIVDQLKDASKPNGIKRFN
ncbi:hypothetical protein AVEN_604-1 [Araneus ventricosus]|uniref:Uncharacterized protein n=1 Tax=Araneus ventricosus TaxID=182803 RepID=A0A4Y2U0R8_ARAVE|nr:hypothetical protein AVEN_604-1 [Araneus ventricosus]